ncbi:MAG: nicotinate-nucleotide adenylyltransferase [Bacillaceae bacterium]|nr:nicotinate-nucleotide adenylyltransferase [Bacillaceae bacterium]
MKNVGLLGGTFDPPHIGHLIVAQEVLHKLSLNEIWFIPSHIPPHKDKANTSASHRLNMLKKAVNSEPQFKIDPIELTRGGVSYTIDTIKELRKLHPDHQFTFIIGADMVEYLPKWHQIDQLKKMVQFVGVKREGYQLEERESVKIVDIPGIDISSTELRKRFRADQPTKYWLPESVEKYIREHGLYGCKKSSANR